MALRAIELLDIKNDKINEEESNLILDLGCGGGLSGRCIPECGHTWVGVDISESMLNIAVEADSLSLLNGDLGVELPFKPESFDYAISISAVQWLFQSYNSKHDPIKRIRTFLRSLYDIIKFSAVIQFYCSKKESDILKKESIIAGFYSEIIVDDENTKNSKTYLVLNKYRKDKKVFIKNKIRKNRAKVE